MHESLILSPNLCFSGLNITLNLGFLETKVTFSMLEKNGSLQSSYLLFKMSLSCLALTRCLSSEILFEQIIHAYICTFVFLLVIPSQPFEATSSY